jgi:hypothetical protein
MIRGPVGGAGREGRAQRRARLGGYARVGEALLTLAPPDPSLTPTRQKGEVFEVCST